MELTLLKLDDAVRAELGRQAAAKPPALAREALLPDLFELNDLLNLPAGIRRITSPANRRDLNPLMQERMQEVCYFLAVTTPFGKRIVELLTSYAVGEGFHAVAEEPAVQEVIDAFWNDPVNDLPRNLRAWHDELATFGELLLPVAVNQVNGLVRLGYVDPQDLEAVEYGAIATGEDQAELSIPVSVKLKMRLGEREGRRLELVRKQEDPNDPAFGLLAGDAFYLAINKAKSASRGISDLFNLADWIDVLDQIVFDGADRVRFMNAFIWHYIVDGADDKALDEFRKKVTKSPPRQGGVQVTNRSVEIKAMNPDLKSYEFGETITNLKAYGLGGIGFPMHWFADPTDANRATAAEMGEPTIKKLTDRQNILRHFVMQLVEFQLDQAQARGVLPRGVNRQWKLDVPDVSVKDMAKASGTLQTTGSALAVGEDRGWIRSETAARAFHAVLTQLGIEVDSHEEFEAAQEEKADREAREINAMNDQANLDAALRAARPATEMRQ